MHGPLRYSGWSLNCSDEPQKEVILLTTVMQFCYSYTFCGIQVYFIYSYSFSQFLLVKLKK